MKKEPISYPNECKDFILGIKDVQEMLSGKWKYRILAALYYLGTMRFMDLKRHIDTVSPKVLSDELKSLEMNHLVKRTVCDTKPVTVEYELTELGKSFGVIIEAMGQWGIKYRQLLFGNHENTLHQPSITFCKRRISHLLPYNSCPNIYKPVYCAALTNKKTCQTCNE